MNERYVIEDPENVPNELVSGIQQQVPQDTMLSAIQDSVQRRCTEIILEYVEAHRDNEECRYPYMTMQFPTQVLVAWASLPGREEQDVYQLCKLITRLEKKRLKKVYALKNDNISKNEIKVYFPFFL